MSDHGIDLYDADDARLLRLAGAGNAEAFGVLSERHAWAARKLARLLASPADVEEVVAEAFGRVRAAIGRGGGPSNAVRPYVLTALRRVCDEREHGQAARLSPNEQELDEQQLTDPGVPLVDPAVAGTELTIAARAYLSLPARWRAVLWHAEIEQEHPLVVTPLLGLARNGIGALDREAIDGLRQAFVQLYVMTIAQPECEPVAEQLDAYVRDALPRPDARQVSEHLRGCDECRAASGELADIGATLRGTVAPLILGPAADAYLVGMGVAGASDVAGSMVTLAVTPADGDEVASAAPDLRNPTGSRHARRRLSPSIAVAAGVVLVVLVSGAVVLKLNSNTGSTGPRSAIASPPAAPVVGLPSQVAVTPSPVPSPVPISAPLSPQASPVSEPQTLATLSASLDISQAQFGSTRTTSTDEVDFGVANTGSVSSGPLTVEISLPRGSSAGGQSSSPGPGFTGGVPESSGSPLGGFGWNCEPTQGGVVCMHAAVLAGQQVTGRLSVTISGFMTCGRPVRLTASSGGATAQAARDLRC